MMRWSERPRWLRWVLEGIVMLMIVVAIHTWQQQDHLRGAVPISTFTSIAQTQIDLTQWGDRPVLLHFSASWCPICQMMQSGVSAVAQDYPVITILVQMSDQEVADWLTAHPNLLPTQVVRDDSGMLLKQFGGKALPMDVIVIRHNTGEVEVVTSEQGFTSELGLRIRLWLLMMNR